MSDNLDKEYIPWNEGDDEYDCPDCWGSGEGPYEGTVCKTCRGLGVIRNEREEIEP